MKFFALGLVFLCLFFAPAFFLPNAQVQSASISTADPDFTIVLFPDTQYYHGQYAYVLKDQVNWVVSHKSTLNIKAVVGLGDMVDGGGYPVDSAGNVNGSCSNIPSANWKTQWQDTQSVVATLNSNGIYYQPTIGNHDYDCQADRPQPRSTTNYFHYLGNLSLKPTTYILDSSGNRTPNFYKIMQIGSTNYMILSLELFPQSWVVAKANSLISSFGGPVIVVTHAYLANDGAGPTFNKTFPAGTAYPLCSGFPSSIYSCLNDSYGSYKPVGGGTDGIGLWYQLISAHANVFMALSGHVRNPNPGNYPFVPNYNGAGHVDCNAQSWTTLCSSPNRPIQILSDYQGQGNGGYFGYGYLKILNASPSKRTVSVLTYSPSIATRPGNFPSGIPAYKADAYNQFTLNFPNTFGGPDHEVTQITSPHDGSHVPLTFGISAAAHGPDSVNGIQVWVDGIKQRSYSNGNALPSGTTATLPGSGVHRVAVQSYDATKAMWVKSVVYVMNP